MLDIAEGNVRVIVTIVVGDLESAPVDGVRGLDVGICVEDEAVGCAGGEGTAAPDDTEGALELRVPVVNDTGGGTTIVNEDRGTV